MNNCIENQGGSRCCRKKSQQGPEKVVVLGPGSTTYFGYGRFKPKNLTREQPKAFGRRVYTADNHTSTKANLMYRIQLRDGSIKYSKIFFFVKIAIFYTDTCNLLWRFFMSETSENIHNFES